MTERRVRADQLPKGAGTADEVVPVPAASVVLLRGEPFEVLLMRRNERSTFVPGAWVFPGGTLDPADARGGEPEDLAVRRCAVREVLEETGIWLGPAFDGVDDARRRLLGGEDLASSLDPHLGSALDDLVLTARWVTPVGVPKRFDTWFFLARVDGGVHGTPDDSEALELAWMRPAEALRLHEEGSFPMVFPTIRNLEDLASYDTSHELLEARRKADIRITQPVLVIENGQRKIVIPEES